MFFPCWRQNKDWLTLNVLTRRASLNFISFTVSYNQPTDGERVCTLQSPIGSFWSHALFLIPLRTCFIAFSPHTGSDQTEITGQLLVLDWLVLLLLSAGKRKRSDFSVFRRSCLFWLTPWTLQLVFGCWRDAVRILDRDQVIGFCFSVIFFPLRAQLIWMQQPQRSD